MEPQYSGARIEGDVVTLDFVKKMMDDFKHQKNLHQRYVWESQYYVTELVNKYYWAVFSLHFVSIL